MVIKDIWVGYSGLSIAFIILSSVVLWHFINSKARLIVKVFIILITIWYGLALYHTVPNLMGWPTNQSIPDNNRVLALRIKEPNPKDNDPGMIYLWLNIRSAAENKGVIEKLDPSKIFNYPYKNDPRAYQLPYSRKLHKAIVVALKEKKNIPGSWIKLGKMKKSKDKMKSSKYLRPDDPLEFKIINPITLMPKAG